MSPNPAESGRDSQTARLDCLTTGRRRQVLRVLAERPAAQTERELAAALVAGPGAGPEDVAADDLERAHVSLAHVDLPKLADADLVEWDRSDGVVASTDPDVVDDPRFEAILEAESDARAEVLLDEECRAVLAAVRSHRIVTRDELAREVAARQCEGAPAADAVADADRRLHHVQLPKLEDTALVDYDAQNRTVVYDGPADFPALSRGPGPSLGPHDEDEVGPEIKIP